MMKQIHFKGTSKEDLREFPCAARQDAGYQLRKIQNDKPPSHWKPFKTVGPGTKEIIIKDDGDEFRVMYVIKFEERVYVLHAFQKKDQKTRQSDIDIAKARYKEIANKR